MQTTEMNFLSFFKTSDVYDPDKIASDEEAIRQYYMRNGYADFRIINTAVVYDPAQKGYIVTITVDEGPQYHVSGVSVNSHHRRASAATLCSTSSPSIRRRLQRDRVEKSVEAMTRELARRGYAFSEVRPRGERDNANHTIALGFTIDDAPKVYIERIDIRGNTRTRDYVIRREFDIGEGDPYNKVLIERGERRLNSLGFFKKVTSQRGRARRRTASSSTVDVEDQPTGSVSVSGGYSTLEGFARRSRGHGDQLPRPRPVRAAQRLARASTRNGWGITFTEPYLFDQRLAGGFDIYHKQQLQNTYALYQTYTTGGTCASACRSRTS